VAGTTRWIFHAGGIYDASAGGASKAVMPLVKRPVFAGDVAYASISSGRIGIQASS